METSASPVAQPAAPSTDGNRLLAFVDKNDIDRRLDGGLDGHTGSDALAKTKTPNAPPQRAKTYSKVSPSQISEISQRRVQSLVEKRLGKLLKDDGAGEQDRSPGALIWTARNARLMLLPICCRSSWVFLPGSWGSPATPG